MPKYLKRSFFRNYKIEEYYMTQINNRRFLKPVELTTPKQQIASLIRSLRQTKRTIQCNQASEITKNRFVSLVNDFQSQNNFSVKKTRFLESIDSQYLRLIFKHSTKFHSGVGNFTIDQLNKGLEGISKGTKTPVSHNLQLDLKRIMEFMSDKIVGQYNKTLDQKLKNMRKNKRIINLKLDTLVFKPQMHLLQITNRRRIPAVRKIHDRMTEVQGKYGRLTNVSPIQYHKERILSQVNTSLQE